MFRGAARLFPHRWPIVFVAPALAYGGYTGWHLIALTAAVAVLAEMAFAIVRMALLDREG